MRPVWREKYRGERRHGTPLLIRPRDPLVIKFHSAATRLDEDQLHRQRRNSSILQNIRPRRECKRWAPPIAIAPSTADKADGITHRKVVLREFAKISCNIPTTCLVRCRASAIDLPTETKISSRPLAPRAETGKMTALRRSRFWPRRRTGRAGARRKPTWSGSAALALALAPTTAVAGAWTPAVDHGEVIVTTIFDQSNAGYDQIGHFTPTPQYRSLQTSVYIDYGLTDWLAATVKPSLQSSTLGAPANQKFTGLGDSEIGLRGRVWQSDAAVVSLQADVRLPTTAGAANASLQGSKNADFDFRLLAGKNVFVGPLPGFIDLQVGYRLRGGKPPDEARADFSFGLICSPN